MKGVAAKRDNIFPNRHQEMLIMKRMGMAGEGHISTYTMAELTEAAREERTAACQSHTSN